MPEKKYPKITKKDLVEGVKKWKEENETHIPCMRCEHLIAELFRNPSENKEARAAFLKDPSKLKCDLCNGKKRIKIHKQQDEENELPTEEYRKAVSREIAKRTIFTFEQIYTCYCYLHSDFAVWQVIKSANLKAISLETSLSQFIQEHKDEWDEEFEDEILIDFVKNDCGFSHDYREDYPNNEVLYFNEEQKLIKVIKKFGLLGKVIIKARKGEIVIRRIE